LKVETLQILHGIATYFKVETLQILF